MKLAEPGVTSSRQTKYTAAVVEATAILKHATTGQILGIVQQIYPEVSETTIRRVADRLLERGVLGSAPKTIDGCERYDTDTTLHHHFLCDTCSHLCNIADSDQVQASVALLKSLNKHCHIAGAITLQGLCRECSELPEARG